MSTVIDCRSHLTNNQTLIVQESSQNQQKNQMVRIRLNKKAKRSKIREKAIKIVLSIVLLFFIQWAPLWLFELYKAMTTNDYIENIHLINTIITMISYSNSISNPLLYIILTHKFRIIPLLISLKLIKKPS